MATTTINSGLKSGVNGAVTRRVRCGLDTTNFGRRASSGFALANSG